jgi:hypothetical protein
MSAWLKLVYNRRKLRTARDWRELTWISDGHRITPDGAPSYRPGYEVGDEIVVYSVEDGVSPARLRVVSAPEFDPGRVEREGFRGDGARWGWLTETRTMASVDLDAAPTLLELGISPLSVRQQDHIRLTEQQHARAARAIQASARVGRGRARPVPIEGRHAESFEQRFEKSLRTALREEQRLVREYARYLERRGRTVYRHRLVVPGSDGPLYSDLYEEDRRHLVEAKARVSRPAIRMAIGQLADYARLIEPRPKRRGVLLPDRPSDDLIGLLASQSIDAIWRKGAGWTDNAGGAYV